MPCLVNKRGCFYSMKSSKIIIISGFVILIGAYFIIPEYKNFMDMTFKAFASGDFEKMRDFVANYGAYAAIVSFLLMILQSVAAPLPAFIITLANAILSWSSAMAGAAICFYIARILGREAAEKLTSKAGLNSIDNFFERYGTHSILIARLLPFISFDLVSYAAGLTAMKFLPFFIATGVGQLPATIIYSYVGGMLTGGAKFLMTGLLILFALSALIILLRKMYTEKHKIEKIS